MNSKRSKLIQIIVVSVVMIRLLVAAWPGMAQDLPISDYPAISNSDSVLTFVSCTDLNNLEIYTARADGTNLTQRTNTAGSNSVPRFNTNASQIAFVSTRDGNSEIYSMYADGSNQVRLTNTSEDEETPVWSPDGTKIAFSTMVSGNQDVYAMNANGTGRTRLTTGTADDTNPAWSPDGSQIAFLSGFDSTDMDLWLMNANGSNQHLLASIPFVGSPRWSPDGARLAVSADGNHDGWTEVAYLNKDGTGLTFPAGYAANNYTHFSPAWSPDGQSIAFANEYYPHFTFISSYIDVVNLNTHVVSHLIPASCYVSPDWQTMDTTDHVPPVSAANVPEYVSAPDFLVNWSGSDSGSGIAFYDIQVRDGQAGMWTTWITATTSTSMIFNGQLGHIYYFQSRAHDHAGNLEAYPGGDGDTLTHTPLYVLNSQALGNRDQFIAQAQALTAPAALNQPKSDRLGKFSLYYNISGTHSLTVTGNSFGFLPSMLNVIVSDTSSNPIVYLPPLDNQISDSHFESGNLALWNPSGDLSATITSTAHTGNFAALLGGSVPTDTITAGPWHSTIEQTINVSPTIVSGTLSLLYRVDAVEPLSDTLKAYVVGANNTLTFTLPVTTSEWTHAWFDVSAWNEPTATVKVDFAIADVGREATIILDEIAWGSAIEGSHTVFLPIARR